MGVGGGGGGDWHGQAGRGATCMDLESREEVRDAYLRRTRSISPTGFVSLCPSLARRGWGERRDNPGSSQGKKETEGNRKAQHHHSQQIERARGNSPLSNALRRGGFLYSHYFLFPSGIIIQYIFFSVPLPHDHTCRLPSIITSPGGRLAWYGSQPLGAEGRRPGGH